MIFTDIKKKHSSHAITSDINIAETAHSAEFFLSDGLIITGIATGAEADSNEIECAKNSTSCPILVGSGITLDNIENYLKYADGVIVGSYVKENGYWKNKLIKDKVKALMDKVNSLT